jgi:hypothetical protein
MNTQAGAENHSTGVGKKADRPGRAARMLRIGSASLVAAAASLTALSVAGPGVAGAATHDGTATITNLSNGSIAFPTASSTVYTISAPTGAVCSGNTSSNGTNIYTYLVPYGTNVQNLTVVHNAISSPSYALLDDTGSPVDNIQVASNDVVPSFATYNLEWGPGVSEYSLLPSLLDAPGGQSGVWEAGIACATSSGITDYWNTEITFTADSNDPNGFQWSAVSGDPNNGANPEVPYAVILPLLGAGIIGAAVLIRRRRTSTSVV